MRGRRGPSCCCGSYKYHLEARSIPHRTNAGLKLACKEHAKNIEHIFGLATYVLLTFHHSVRDFAASLLEDPRLLNGASDWDLSFSNQRNIHSARK